MKPKKILVVEDDKVSQRLIANVLKNAGYQVAAADDAPTAVKLAREENPDLITLDVNLAVNSPGDSWDGFTVAGWLRRMGEDKTRPIIVVVSGAKPDEIIEKASAVGAYTLLPKPIEKQKLLDVIAAALKGR